MCGFRCSDTANRKHIESARADPEMSLSQRCSTWPEPGDRLRGQSAEFLAGVAGRSAQAAGELDRSDVGGVAIDTTSLSPDESADAIRQAIGWPDYAL
jgi:hypothetical protein